MKFHRQHVYHKKARNLHKFDQRINSPEWLPCINCNVSFESLSWDGKSRLFLANNFVFAFDNELD